MERLVRFALVLLLAGCWTGGGAPAAAPEPARPRDLPALEISLERGPCFGMCPQFKLTIRGDGRVDWVGKANVAAPGVRRGRISRDDLEALDREVDLARFFDRDRYGRIPREPVCTTRGNTRTCTFTSAVICGDISHSIITVRRGHHAHRIDFDHCAEDDDALDELEARIVMRAGAAPWIGRR